MSISSDETLHLFRILAQDAKAVETRLTFAVASAIVGEHKTLRLAPEMTRALKAALVGHDEFDQLRHRLQADAALSRR